MTSVVGRLMVCQSCLHSSPLNLWICYLAWQEGLCRFSWIINKPNAITRSLIKGGRSINPRKRCGSGSRGHDHVARSWGIRQGMEFPLEPPEGMQTLILAPWNLFGPYLQNFKITYLWVFKLNYFPITVIFVLFWATKFLAVCYMVVWKIYS